jgi:hypothetical protein
VYFAFLYEGYKMGGVVDFSAMMARDEGGRVPPDPEMEMVGGMVVPNRFGRECIEILERLLALAKIGMLHGLGINVFDCEGSVSNVSGGTAAVDINAATSAALRYTLALNDNNLIPFKEALAEIEQRVGMTRNEIYRRNQTVEDYCNQRMY